MKKLRGAPLFVAMTIIMATLACSGLLPDQTPTPQPLPAIPIATATSTAPMSGGESAPIPTDMPEGSISPGEMEEALLAAYIPPYDPYEWEAREGSIPWDAPRVASGSRIYQVGDIEHFFLGDRWTEIDAELVAMGEHAYFWVEVGHPMDRAAYERAAQIFDEQVYPIEHRYFGSEWNPGVDNDPRLFILHATGIDALGFFSPPDQTTRAVDSASNEHEMVYMGLDSIGEIGGGLYMATLAHEFQHMIQANTDSNEANWVDEGLAQMAELLTGYPGYAEDAAYLADTDVPLNFWDAYGDAAPSYAANFLFWLYLWEQFGDDFFIQAAQSPREGLMAVEEALQARGLDRSVYDVFSDWTVANLIDDPALGDGRYGYDNFESGGVCPLIRPESSPPIEDSFTIAQFTPHYHVLGGGTRYNVDFNGPTVAQLVPTSAYSGGSFWWSNRRDHSHTRLTRQFDLAGLSQATLRYSLWYETEDGYDALFVSASINGGATWQALYGSQMSGSVDEFGLLPGYSGSSGGWVTDQIDLTPFVGGAVLISFDYVTDVNYTLHGVALDDIEVPELGYFDGGETSDGGWQAEGWARTSNVVPQYWGLYLVMLGDQTTVIPIPVQDGQAHAEGDFPSGATEAILVVAASAPITRVPAEYTLRLDGDFVPRTGASLEPGVLLRDDFELPCWAFDTYSDYGSSHGYSGGRLHIIVDDPDFYDVAWTEDDFNDALIEVDTYSVQPVGDNAFGLVCRFTDYQSYYLFEIREDGTYGIFAKVGGSLNNLTGLAYSDAINTGPGAVNHLRATCVGDQLSLEVNGQFLAQVTDSRLTRGSVGMHHRTFAHGTARVEFDDFIVRQMP